MKKITFILLLFLISACTPAALSPTAAPSPTSAPTRHPPAAVPFLTPAPTFEATLPESTLSAQGAPVQTIPPELLPPISARPVISSAKIEWKDQPLQPYLLLQGTLVNSCQDWAIYVNPPTPQSLIVVSVAVDVGISAGSCSENPVPLQREVLLGPFDPGQYSLYVNESRVGDLTIK